MATEKKLDKAAIRKGFKLQVGKAWDKAKTVKATSYSFVAPPGDYPARISKVTYGVDKNKHTYFNFAIVLKGVDPDKVPNPKCQVGHFINDDPEDWANGKTKEEKLVNLSADFQRLGKNPEEEDPFDMADALTEEKPWILVKVGKGKEKTSKTWVNIQRLLTEDELEEMEEDDSDESEEDESEVEEEGEDDNEETEEGDEEEEVEEEEEKPKRKTSSKKKPEPEPEEEEEESEEEEEPNDDYDEPEEEEEEEEKPAPKKTKKGATAKASGVAMKKGAKVIYSYRGGKPTDWKITAVHDDDTVDITRPADGRVAKNVPVSDLS